MMKKMSCLLLSILTVVLLAACTSNKTSSPEWLKGDWYSEDWDATFTIKEDKDKWSIQSGEDTITEDATLSQKGKLYTLEDKDGVSYVIEQKSESEMYYQQVAPEGVLGTTARVPFKKVE